jgi:DNA polymerase-3 subunit alpha (Gram-positive type)
LEETLVEGEPLVDQKFADIFPGISNEEKEMFKHVEILNINVYKKSKRMQINILSKEFISPDKIKKLENDCAKLLGFNGIQINPKFDVSLSLEKKILGYWKWILNSIYTKVALTRGILDGSSFVLKDKILSVNLRTTGKDILKSQSVNVLMEESINDLFSESVKVSFIDKIEEDYDMERYIRKKADEEVLHVAKSLSDESKSKGKNKNDKGIKLGISEFKVILGKKFDDNSMEISRVNSESGKVCIQGDVFKTEFREIRGGRILSTFEITDYTGSITAKQFVEKSKINFMMERIKTGTFVKVRGEVQYDKYLKDSILMVTDVLECGKEIIQDNAEEKRVELHLHTQMSAMDAVTSVKDLVERAAMWGHKAVAITDHGVVQAFPDAYEAASSSNIKIIYGVECYLLDDKLPTVYNANKYRLDDEFVIVDIETTGLNAENDRITEIGAVKIKNGKILDSFCSFVNPEIPIPSFIVKLTGITDEMVKDAPHVSDALKDLLKFIDGDVIVAHNAPFDLGFLRVNAGKIGKRINNPVIDTLQLARSMIPELKKYKLGEIAKHLNVEIESQHRALGDAMMTAKVFEKFMETLSQKGAVTIEDIENECNSSVDYKNAAAYHAIILVKNYTGLKNLYKIISESHMTYFYKKPRVPKDLYMKFREGLIIGTACEAGELFQAIKNRASESDIMKIVRFYDYLEIQPLANNEFLINGGEIESREALIKINKKIVKLGEKSKKPVVATCDVHFMDQRDEVFRRILMGGQGFLDADNQAPLYFRTTEEMLTEFSYLGKEKAKEVVIYNTNSIADSIEVLKPIPDGTFPPKIESAEEEIIELTYKRAKEIYGENLPEIVEKRIKKELDSIIKNGFSVMYIASQKIVAKAIEDSYLVCSRGSVGSSLIAFMLGITEVNALEPHYICKKCNYTEFILDGSFDCGFDLPDKKCPNCSTELKKDGYDIPFETFLGFDGDKEPDIDLNFSGEYQSSAHKYTEELFGKGNVFRAGTISTLQDKTAYGFVKGYFEKRDIVNSNAEINRLVLGCSGIKKTTGQHPGGVMIVPEDQDIYNFTPIQRPANDMTSDTIITHFDYHSISGRLLKLDILGHDDPTILRMLQNLTGVDVNDIPIGDKKTMSIFNSTEALGIKPSDINSKIGTFGVPEFGTKLARQLLLETMPETISELVKISGLSHGTDVWLNNAQLILKNQIATLSEAICCRDDIMQFLTHKGLAPIIAFKIMEDVRKNKGLKEEYEDNMLDNKIPLWYIDSCKKIKYLFPKAHAAAYVMTAFRIAWFKVYYPEAFYAAYFTVRADDFDADIMIHGADKIKLMIKQIVNKGNDVTTKEKSVLKILEVINEMNSRGIKFIPVNLYKSDAVKFLITENGILPPLISLQGLGINAAKSIVNVRSDTEFSAIDEFRIKTKVTKTVIDILKKHGCLEGMHDSNQMSFF